MRIKVLLSSGETDQLQGVEDARIDMSFGGALLVFEKLPTKGEEGQLKVIYAPGMWMKVEYHSG